MSLETREIFEFGPYRADTVRRLLFRDNQPVPLTSKAFDTLAVLLRKRDRVVEKRELLQTIWPDSFVEESNLAQHISALRKALGDQPGENRFITTVPGVGYRFVAPVTVPSATPVEMRTAEVVIEEEVEVELQPATPLQLPAPRLQFRWALAAALVLALVGTAWYWSRRDAAEVGTLHSLAVLPFQQLSPAPGDEYLGIGLADAVITRLSNIRQLVVRPTNSVLKYAGPNVALKVPARELGVEALLDGKVQKSGDSIRVTVQLIRASDNRPLWAGTFDAVSTGMFSVEDSVSASVARALELRLANPEKQHLARSSTVNAEAYRYYLQGRYSGLRFTIQGLNQAIDYFDRAIALDPGYALAYSGLADAYTTTSDWILSPRQALPKAEAAARKAIALDDSLAEAHASLGHALMHQWKLADADKEFRRALALNPNHTACYFFYAEYLSAVERFDDSVSELKKAIQIDPGSAEFHAFLSWPLSLKGDLEGALAATSETIRIEPDSWVAHMFAGFSLNALHRYAEAIPEFEKARAINPDSTVNLSGLAAAWAQSGKRVEAEQAIVTMGNLSKSQYVSPMDIAVVETALGKNDQAFQWLEKAFDDQAEMLLFLKRFKPLDNLHSDPRFNALLRRVGVTE